MAHVVPRELNLNNYGHYHHHYRHGSIVNKINAVPGLRTSTAFFTFLGENLSVNPSAMSSVGNTPNLEATSSQTLAPPSPSPLASEPMANPVPNDLPSLSVDTLSSRSDRIEALKLVADSIAQQRQTASYHLIFHPYTLPGLGACLAAAYQYGWRVQHDLGTTLMLLSGVIMTYLLIIRYVTGNYISLAEGINFKFLQSPNDSSSGGEEDTLIGVKFDNMLIGALVLRLEPSPTAVSASGKRRTRAAALKGGRGVIRAWTVKMRYRGKGVGKDLLQEAIKVTRERCGRDAEVGFAQEHANSAVVLPESFNGVFRKGERKAAKALDRLLEQPKSPRKRRWS